MYKILFIFISLVSCSIFTSDKNFTCEQGEITEIHISDKFYSTYLSKDINNNWLIDEKISTNKLMVSNLMEILSRIDVEYPLPESKKKEVSVNLFDSLGLNINIYKKSRLIKSYSLLFDSGITYALLKNAKKIYAVYLPGNNIDLEDYLSANPVFWQNNLLFNAKIADITSIKIINNLNNNESFILKQNKDGHLYLSDLNEQAVLFNIDSVKLKRYISYFNILSFEHYITNKERTDILPDSPYNFTICTKDTESSYTVLFKSANDKLDTYGKPLYYDRDYFFICNKTDTVLASWINFDILFKNLSDFQL